MTISLSFAPMIPILYLSLLCATAAIGAIWAGSGRPVWVSLRLLLILALGLLALGPERVEAEHEYLNDIALVIVDDSSSMQMEQRTQIRDLALTQLRQQIEQVPALDLVEVTVPDSPDGTRLFSSIKSGLAQIPAARLAGMMILSDGIVHDILSNFTLNAPAHTMIIGDPQRGDRSLKILEAPKFGIVGEAVVFKIQVDEFGQSGSGHAAIVLRLAGQDDLRVRVQTGIAVSVSMPLTRRGTNLVELNVEAAPEELTLINNRIAVEVTGVRERLRVLLVSGEPYAGVRAWRNLLKSDPVVDLVHFTILRPPTKRDAAPLNEMALIAFPTRELFVNKLDSFDLVIFDRYTRRGVLPLLYLENVARYVENGGALMVAAGPPFATSGSLAKTFLASVLPARPDGIVHNLPFSPTITPIGKRHPVTTNLQTQQKTWGRWGRAIGVTGVTGETVLSTADGKPLLILDRVGEGRVALLLSDQAWLWSRGFEGGGPQYELYRRLAHWLMKEPELEEEALRGRIVAGTLEIELQTLHDNPPPIEVESADGRVWSLELTPSSAGIFTANMPLPDHMGLLTLKSGTLLTVAAQGQLNQPELANLEPNITALAPLAKQTGGAVTSLIEENFNLTLRRTRPQDRQKGRDWIGLQKNNFSVQTQITKRPLIEAWIALIILLLLAGLMWWREGKS